MKKRLIASISIAALISGYAISATAADSSYDYAKVIKSEPITRIIRVSTPREECWDEAVTYRDFGHDDHAVGTVVGAILGSAFGNAVGHSKSNKQVGAVVGAVLGGTLGHAHSTRHYTRAGEYTAVEERCEVYQDYEEHEKVIGFRVSYRYKGKVYTTRTDTAPGETIRVRVTVAAA
jgi:uncharacterized protein YcfJ